MTDRIANLAVEVGADITPLTKGFKRASGEVDSFTARTTAATRKIAGAFKIAAAAAVGMAGGLAIVTKAALSTAENLSDMANQANVTVKRLQELRFAADQNGSSARDMDDALTRLQRRMSLFADNGGGPAKSAIEALGIQVTDTSGNLRKSGDVFDEIVAKFERLRSNAQKAALASALFGEDAGPRLVPLLTQGSRGLDDLANKAERLGLVMDEVAVRDAAEASAQFRALSDAIKTKLTTAIVENGETWKALANGLTDTVIPALTAVLNTIGDIVAAIRSMAAEVSGFIGTQASAVSKLANGQRGAAGDTRRRRQAGSSTQGGGTAAVEGFVTGAGQIGAGVSELFQVTGNQGTVRRNSAGGGLPPVQGPFYPGPVQGPVMPETVKSTMQVIEEETQAHEDRLTDIKKRGATERKKIPEQEYKTVGDITKAGISNLTALTSAGNKELFKVGKVAALAEGLISARKSIMFAYEHGDRIGGPPLGAAFAATAAAAQFANLAAIRSVSYGGGSSGGGSVASGSYGSGAASAAAGAASAAPQQGPLEARISGITRDQLFSGESVLDLLDKLTDAAGDRGLKLVGVQ